MYIHAIAQRERAKTVPVPPAPPYWMWKTLTEKFLKYQTLKLKAKYRKQYEHHLTLKEFGPINDKMVRDIKLRDLERIRDAIHLNHAPSAVHRALTQSKRMLSWAWKYHATDSGLEDEQYEWWTKMVVRVQDARTHARPVDRGDRAHAGSIGMSQTCTNGDIATPTRNEGGRQPRRPYSSSKVSAVNRNR
jgi:hypothetical protein